MPKGVHPKTTFDDLHRLNFRVRAALRRRGQADLLPMTDPWSAPIEPLRAQMLANAELRSDFEEARTVASEELNAVAEQVSDQLLIAVGKDRKDPRYTRFFDRAPSKFYRLPLEERIAVMRGWTASTDAVLVPFHEALRTTTTAAQTAINELIAMEMATAALQQARREYTTQLTGWRDELHEILSKRGRALKKRRKWADRFFRR